MNLSPEQMQFLADKGLSIADVIAFAKLESSRSAGAERQARYRARQKAEVSDVTGDVTGDGNAPALSPAPNEINSNPPPHTHPDINTTRARDPFPMPEWCPSKQVWLDLKANRKAKRLPCTPTAHAKLLRDLDKLADDEWPPGRLLEAIVARGWAAAYDPRDERKPANDRQRSQHQRETTRQTGERVAARFAAASGGATHLLPGPGASCGNDRD